jgi:Flp pilus assembly pilin Flp
MERHSSRWARLGARLTRRLGDRRRGQGFVEYGFILVFVGVALTAALVALAGGINGLFGDINACLAVVPGSTC